MTVRPAIHSVDVVLLMREHVRLRGHPSRPRFRIMTLDCRTVVYDEVEYEVDDRRAVRGMIYPGEVA